MHPQHWGTTNGNSEELNSALARAHTAAQRASDADLNADYERARTHLQNLIDEERQKHIENYEW